MRSSKWAGRVLPGAARLLVCAGVWLSGCSTPRLTGKATAPPAPPPCVAAGEALSPPDVEGVAALRRGVEMGPLYTTQATRAGVAGCRISRESGVIALEYRFRDGGWLRVKRDARIEYTDQETRFVVPPAEPPLAILTRAEQVAFGAKGCGIDWQHAETQPVEGDPAAVDTIFRGDVCNCQARIRNDAAGRVASLILRSTC